ncbi:hypothetical protein C6507_25455, partial [Escherichia coli]|nr:hypothetical protein [Escherichia coli]
PLTDFRGKTSIFSHPVYLFLRKFSLQDSRGGSSSHSNSLSFNGPVFIRFSLWISTRQHLSYMPVRIRDTF